MLRSAILHRTARKKPRIEVKWETLALDQMVSVETETEAKFIKAAEVGKGSSFSRQIDMLEV